MPQEHRLEDLRKSSAPALRHSDLIALARNYSPSQSYEHARSAKWPNRQAKAVRSLAILRRDFGTEAFEAFITTMERVRTEKPVTELAQEERIVRSRFLQSLDRITDPQRKLELLFKNEMFDEASAYIDTLVGRGTFFFYHNGAGGQICKPLLAPEKNEGEDALRDVTFVWHEKPALHPIKGDDPSVQELQIDLRGMLTALKWDADRTARFVRLATDLFDHEPERIREFWTMQAMIRVCRHLLPSDDPHARRMELFNLTNRFYDGRLFELRTQHLPVPMENSKDEMDELNPIVDRFIELGKTEEEVRLMFLDWMQKRAQDCRPQFMLAVAGAKCFKHNDPDREEVLRKKYLPTMWRNLVSYGDASQFQVEMFDKLGSLGLWQGRDNRWVNTSGSGMGRNVPIDNDRKFFQEELVKLLSNAQAGKVFQILVLFGESFGIYTDKVNGVRGNYDGDRKVNTARAIMGALAVDAFERAYAGGNYGVAAALSQQFNCYDENLLKTAAEEFVADEAEATGEKYATVEKKWMDGEVPDSYIHEGEGKEWQDALEAIEAKKLAKLEELKQQRKDQIAEVAQLALDTEQPIRLDWMCYYVATHWPKY